MGLCFKLISGHDSKVRLGLRVAAVNRKNDKVFETSQPGGESLGYAPVEHRAGHLTLVSRGQPLFLF